MFKSKLVKAFRFKKVKTEDEVVEGVVEEVVEELVEEVEDLTKDTENAPEKCIEKLDLQDSAVLLEANVGKEIVCGEDENGDEDDDRPHIRCCLMDEKCLLLKYLDKNTDFIEPRTMEFAEVMTNKVMHEDDLTLKTKVDKQSTTYWLYNKTKVNYFGILKLNMKTRLYKIKLDHRELSVTVNSLTEDHMDRFIALNVPYSTDF